MKLQDAQEEATNMEDKAKNFIEGRVAWAKETAGWLGVILLIGFIKVNFLGGSIEAQFPEYKNYTVLGTELPEDNPKKRKG